MSKNTGEGTSRKGAVKERSQTYNSKTKLFVKRDKKTGRFIGTKKTAFKGVRKEKNCKVAK